MPKVRMRITETLNHVVVVDMDQEELDNLRNLPGWQAGEFAGDYTSRGTISDGSFDLDEIEDCSR